MLKKRILSLLLALILLTGCSYFEPRPQLYDAVYYTLFDTVTQIKGYAESEEEFQAQAQKLYDELETYHRLFDIYNEYEGISNLKTVNDAAGQKPVEVDEKIIHLLSDCKTYFELTNGKVNTAMGSVLSLWHKAREEGLEAPEKAALPKDASLSEAALHCDFKNVIIDEEASTVFLSDPAQSLDAGAIAKGWAVEQVSKLVPSGYLISVGGNVCATGPKADGDAWIIGVESPDENASSFLHTLSLSKGCIVTSGDYQRYYEVNGVRYHHIIDPESLYPSKYWSSVTVVCDNSAAADALSTALFLMPLEEGKQLLVKAQAEAMWVTPSGERFYSSGFENFIQS